MHSAPEFILLPRCIHFAIAAFSEDESFPPLHEALKQVYSRSKSILRADTLAEIGSASPHGRV
jgi:hypothetical protein